MLNNLFSNNSFIATALSIIKHKNNMQRILFPTVKPNATIQVEKEAVELNSHVLALSSDYFDRYFFDDRYPKAENIELPPSTTVEDFKRMVATLYGHRLDDDCIEAVLILADRFFMDNVMALCRQFLKCSDDGTSSSKPKLFKYRMAHKYGWKEMKDKILQTMEWYHFNGVNFFDNAEEYGLLDDEGKAALLARHDELVAQNTEAFGDETMSNKPKLFYFRMAHKYQWEVMKEQFLQELKLDDLNGVNFYENAEEYGQLDEEGKAALLARHAELVAQNSVPPACSRSRYHYVEKWLSECNM